MYSYSQKYDIFHFSSHDNLAALLERSWMLLLIINFNKLLTDISITDEQRQLKLAGIHGF
jgi:hypothetical protein